MTSEKARCSKRRMFGEGIACCLERKAGEYGRDGLVLGRGAM
jgi:hypothetical protein